jgi:hypothetical protein
MVSKCANPECSERFLRLGDGKLFRWDGVDTHHALLPAASAKNKKNKKTRKAEFFWLCGDCARKMTVIFSAELGVTTKTLADSSRTVKEGAIVSGKRDTPPAGRSSESATSRQPYAFRRAAG